MMTDNPCFIFTDNLDSSHHFISPFLLLLSGFLFVPAMSLELTGWGELAELVTNHLFRHDDRNMLLAVIDAKGQANELRQNRAAARPDSNHRVTVALVGLLGFLEQIPVDERTFPN